VNIEKRIEDDTEMFSIEGLEAAQKYNTYECFLELPEFEQVIEIGTCRGGFALMLKKRFDCPIYTIDILDWEPQQLKRELFRRYAIEYIISDVFESYRLDGLLNKCLKTLILCDGGHKKNEFTYFSRRLKVGDFIGCHDYYPKRPDEYTIWPTCEMYDELIEKETQGMGLKKYKPKIFNSCVWTIRYKP